VSRRFLITAVSKAFPKAVVPDNRVVAFHVYAIGVQIYHRGELTASIAHEVNQPLAAVVNNPNACLSLLPKGAPQFDEVRNALTEIVEGCLPS